MSKAIRHYFELNSHRRERARGKKYERTTPPIPERQQKGFSKVISGDGWPGH